MTVDRRFPVGAMVASAALPAVGGGAQTAGGAQEATASKAGRVRRRR